MAGAVRGERGFAGEFRCHFFERLAPWAAQLSRGYSSFGARRYCFSGFHPINLCGTP